MTLDSSISDAFGSTRNGSSSTNVDKPLRGFDVNSLIGNTDDKEDERGSPGSPREGGTLSPSYKSSSGREMSTTPTHPSPNLSVGPPAPPAPPQSSLYPFLLHPGLYQHLASAGLAAGNPNMLLNAQLALMAQQNPMLASAYAQLNAAHAAQAAAHTATPASHPLLSSSDRLRQSHRFSPYSFPPPPPSVGSTGSPASSPNPPSSNPISSAAPMTTGNNGSAFHSIIPRNSSTSSTSILSNSPPPASTSSLPVASTNTTTNSLSSSLAATFKENNSVEGNRKDSSRSPSPTIHRQKSMLETVSPTTTPLASSRPNANDIKSMENLVNGLNGSSSSKFGISHSEVGGGTAGEVTTS